MPKDLEEEQDKTVCIAGAMVREVVSDELESRSEGEWQIDRIILLATSS